jgi:hypothetical protein
MSTEIERREQIADYLRKEFEDGLDEKIADIIEHERDIIEHERGDVMEKWQEERAAQLKETLTEQFEDDLEAMVDAALEKLEEDLA